MGKTQTKTAEQPTIAELKENVIDADKQVTAASDNQWGDMAGVGREHIGADEKVIPFISVLQPLSPELDSIKTARAGMLLNKGTNEVYDGEEGFYFLPVERQQSFVEWTPRERGGGIVARHPAESPVVATAKREAAARGEDPRFTRLWVGEKPEDPKQSTSNQLIQTYYLYGLMLRKNDAGKFEPDGGVLLSFTSTKIKVYKQLMTVVDKLRGNPPLFALPVHVTTTKQKNDKGEFWNFAISPAGGTPNYADALLPPSDPLVRLGYEFSKQIRAEQVKMGDEGGDAAEDDAKDVPF